MEFPSVQEWRERIESDFAVIAITKEATFRVLHEEGSSMSFEKFMEVMKHLYESGYGDALRRVTELLPSKPM